MTAFDVFDFHTYLGKSPFGDFYQSPETLIGLMDENQISAAAVSPFTDTPGPDDHAHQLIVDACNRFAGRFVPFARLDPRYGKRAVEILKEIVEKCEVRGLLFNPVSTDTLPYHPGVIPLMRYAAEKNLPVLIPSGQAYTALPEQIALLATKIPALRVVIGHMGTAAHAVRAIELLSTTPNLFLETSIQQSPYRISILSPFIREGRVLFGSGSPYSHPEVELLKIRTAGLSEVEMQMLFSTNARKLLGLSADEVQQ